MNSELDEKVGVVEGFPLLEMNEELFDKIIKEPQGFIYVYWPGKKKSPLALDNFTQSMLSKTYPALNEANQKKTKEFSLKSPGLFVKVINILWAARG